MGSLNGVYTFEFVERAKSLGRDYSYLVSLYCNDVMNTLIRSVGRINSAISRFFVRKVGFVLFLIRVY